MLAAARDFGAVGRLTYEPMLATILGLSGYFATSGNSLRATVGNVPVGLWEIDARTRYRGFTARAEFAMLFIGETAALNQALAANDRPRRCRSRSAARAATSKRATTCMRLFCPTTDQSVTLFSRFDYVNTQASVAAGLHARRGVPPLRLHGRSRVPPDPADRAQGRLPPALVRRRPRLQRARRRARLDVLMPRTKVFAPLLPVLVLAAAPACNPPSPPPPDDPAEVVVGERLFLETRFAQFFAANGGSDVNQPLASGDPVLDVLETTADARTNPFAGKSMNCRVCHLVDESPDPGTTGTRTYADFARRSPIPDRGDGRTHTPRNSPPLVNASLARDENFFLHYDGEFPSAEDLVVGTFTGRNFGWLPDERAQAVAHIARVIRADDGSDEFALPCYGLSYTTILAGMSPAIPEICRLPEALRLDVNAVSDEQVVRGAAAVVAAYMRALVYQQDGAGQYIGSPFDRFLILNGLPRQPEAGETGGRLRATFARGAGGAARAQAAGQPRRARVRAPRSGLRVRRGRAGRPAHLPGRARRRGADGGRARRRRYRQLHRLPRAAALHRLRLPQQRRRPGGLRRRPRRGRVRGAGDPGPGGASGGAGDLLAAFRAVPDRRRPVPRASRRRRTRA